MTVFRSGGQNVVFTDNNVPLQSACYCNIEIKEYIFDFQNPLSNNLATDQFYQAAQFVWWNRKPCYFEQFETAGANVQNFNEAEWNKKKNTYAELF